MNSALYFNVKDVSGIAAQRCRQAIRQLGAPLKSDSGHFLTGVVKSGQNNVDLRVSWLDQPGGSQITVMASHDQLEEAELQNVAKRFQFEYVNKTALQRNARFKISYSALFVTISAIAAVAVYAFSVISTHK